MTLLEVLIGLAVFGLIVGLIVQYVAMPEPIRKTIIAIAVIVLIVWLIRGFGLLGPLNTPIHIR